MSPATVVIQDRFQTLWDARVVDLWVVRGDTEPLDSTTALPEIELSRDEELRLWVVSLDSLTSSTNRYRVLGLPRRPAYTLPGDSSQHQRPRALVEPFHMGVAWATRYSKGL